MHAYCMLATVQPSRPETVNQADQWPSDRAMNHPDWQGSKPAQPKPAPEPGSRLRRTQFWERFWRDMCSGTAPLPANFRVVNGEIQIPSDDYNLAAIEWCTDQGYECTRAGAFPTYLDVDNMVDHDGRFMWIDLETSQRLLGGK